MNEQNKCQLTVNLCGSVEFHVFIHFDHAALAAKLEQATDKLRDAVETASEPPKTS